MRLRKRGHDRDRRPGRSEQVEQVGDAVDDRVRTAGARARSRMSTEALIPLRTRIVREPPRRPSATSSAEVVADHGQLGGGRAEALHHRPHGGARRLADDDGTPAGHLGERGGDHRSAAEDRPVRAGVRGDVASGQERRAGEDRPGGALERVRSPRRPCARRGRRRPARARLRRRCRSRSRRGTRAPPRCRTGSTVAPWWRAQVRPDAARAASAARRRRRRGPRRAGPAANPAGGMWLPFVKSASGRPDARIRSSTSRAPGSDVHVVAVAVHERAVDVEHEAPDVVKSHGATPRGRRPS